MALNYDVWANLYDTIYGDVVDDIPYYVSQIRESDDKVLELGCGTGRVSIPIAENTSNLTALDLSSQMVAVLNKKAVEKGLILDCVIGDMRSFDIQSVFNENICFSRYMFTRVGLGWGDEHFLKNTKKSNPGLE